MPQLYPTHSKLTPYEPAATCSPAPRFKQPLSDDQIWTMLQTAANSPGSCRS